MKTITADRVTPLETLIKIARGGRDIAHYHAKKLMDKGMVSKSFEDEGVGRPRAVYVLTESGMSLMHMSDISIHKKKPAKKH